MFRLAAHLVISEVVIVIVEVKMPSNAFLFDLDAIKDVPVSWITYYAMKLVEDAELSEKSRSIFQC